MTDNAGESNGCPCEETCCLTPSISGVEWECSCAPDDCYCDENWMLECRSCGMSCGCNV